MEMFHLQYECCPNPESEDYHDSGGAYVNCWVKAESIESAQQSAELAITENQWTIIKLEESFPVCLDDYDNDEESVKYHKQAEINDEVYVYHMWPNEPQESDPIH